MFSVLVIVALAPAALPPEPPAARVVVPVLKDVPPPFAPLSAQLPLVRPIVTDAGRTAPAAPSVRPQFVTSVPPPSMPRGPLLTRDVAKLYAGIPAVVNEYGSLALEFVSRNRRDEAIRQKQATMKPGETVVYNEIHKSNRSGNSLGFDHLSEYRPTPVMKAATGPRTRPVLTDPPYFPPAINTGRIVVTTDNWWKEGHEPRATAAARLPASLPPIPSASQLDAPRLRIPSATPQRLDSFEFPKPTITPILTPRATPTPLPAAPTKWHPPLVLPKGESSVIPKSALPGSKQLLQSAR